MNNRLQPDELEALRRQNRLLAEENARLKEMLGLEERDAATATQQGIAPVSGITGSSSSAAKIELFQSLFRGRADVFARRWESRTGGRGYAPACANEWRSGVCDKPRAKCADCANRELVALSASTIEDHLTGRSTVGIYAMLEDETCHFLAIDLDDEGWRGDVIALRSAASASGVDCHVEVSRSGGGAHAWFFFAEPVPVALARRLGTALLTQAARGRHALSLRSYDRLFPS